MPYRKADDLLPTRAEKAAVVRTMFDRIAPRYDLLNRMISLSLDQRWRRTALEVVGVRSEDRVIDLACGTGDFSEFAVGVGAQVIGVDFSAAMLRGARRRRIKATWVQADASHLPLPNAWATVVVSGFALRNFVSIPVALAEAARVLQPGGRLALLEVDTPSNPVMAFGNQIYFQRIVPLIGGLLSDASAYAYLPRSVSYLPNSQELHRIVEAAGFEQFRKRHVFGGVAQIVQAVRR